MTPTGPTRLWPVVRSGVLSVPGTVRAGLEPFLRRRPVEGDISVGALITGRLGREVADRLVDPLLGSLHAADIHRLSLQATAPQLVPLARDGRSLVLGRPRASGGRAPGFVTWPGGLTALTDALLAGVAVTVRTGTAVTVVAPRAGGGFVVTVADGTEVAADAAVLAVPAHVAAPLVRPFATAAADLLGQVRSASVATVLATYPRGALPVTTTGLLVPTSAQRTLRAATFLSAKWPHLAQREEVLVRLSAGHADSDVGAIPDDDLVTRLTSDLADLMGVAATPVRTVVERWPDALPQLEVGHVERIAAARADLDRFPGLALAGAAYDGLGLVACLRSGERAAAGVLAADGAPVTAGATVTTR